MLVTSKQRRVLEVERFTWGRGRELRVRKELERVNRNY